jgi:3',5'-cyclic AMP phosphodiesterase CpdA
VCPRLWGRKRSDPPPEQAAAGGNPLNHGKAHAPDEGGLVNGNELAEEGKRLGVKLILCGHTHASFIDDNANNGPVIACAPSLCAYPYTSDDITPDNFKHPEFGFHIISIDPTGNGSVTQYTNKDAGVNGFIPMEPIHFS